MNKREHYIDISKGIAMMLVILGHCALTPQTVVWWSYSFHMPLFFMLSGLTFNPDKYTNFISFFKAKARSLLIPYFSLCGILWFWVMILQNKQGFICEQTLNSFIGIFLGYRGTKYYFSMWFLPVLFVAELILYLVCKLIKEKKILLIPVMVFASVIEWILLHVHQGGFFWSLDLVPIALSFIALGYILKVYKERLEKIYHIGLFFITGIINLVSVFLCAWKEDKEIIDTF